MDNHEAVNIATFTLQLKMLALACGSNTQAVTELFNYNVLRKAITDTKNEEVMVGLPV